MTPRLGFLGVGWIGRDRMLAIHRSGVAEVAVVSDVDPAAAGAAADEVGATAVAPDRLLTDLGDPSCCLDGLVIATPSALHADQAVAAFDAGLAVFCQKPLGRDAAEARRVVDAARRADRLLGLDLSYRHTAAFAAVHEAVQAGAIGAVHAADLVFHNAYGPDKPWFTDPVLSGGGCAIDLGTHLVDLVRWLLPGDPVVGVRSRLFAAGRPLPADGSTVEDHALVWLDLRSGAVATLACSWFLHAGRDAVIAATLHGESGSLAVENVDGSFYDLRAELRRGTSREVLTGPPDEWGGRAAVRWAEQLAGGARFERSAEELVEISEVLDEVYGR